MTRDDALAWREGEMDGAGEASSASFASGASALFSYKSLSVLAPTVGDTEKVGELLASRLRAGSLVALYGDLGAGKTQFVRGVARGLGLDPQEVSSPTFTVLQSYGDGTLLHLDLYRLEDAEDVEVSGLLDVFSEPEAVVVLEWSERVPELIPETAWRVRLTREGTLPVPGDDGVIPEDRLPRRLELRGPAAEVRELEALFAEEPGLRVLSQADDAPGRESQDRRVAAKETEETKETAEAEAQDGAEG